MPTNTNLSTTHITMHTDGVCEGNPGIGGYGAIIQFWSGDTAMQRLTLSRGESNTTTNNRMKLTAGLEGLRFILIFSRFDKDTPITISSDSQYLVKGITEWIVSWKKNGWRNSSKKPIENQDLWLMLDNCVSQFSKLSFKWVRGHNGDTDNEAAEALASAAIPNRN